MTWSKYHKNCILTGPLDAYCLVCENHMRNQDDCDSHLKKQSHIDNLKATLYFGKYKDDYIRKLKKSYYCEFCNLLFSTAIKVDLHVIESQHIERKGKCLLRRIGNNIIAFNNVLIHENAWNGFVNDTCVVCDSDFDNEDIHKTDNSHILKLIQKPVQFGQDDTVYRKTDENLYQCLTCNLLLPLESTLVHSKEASHQQKLVDSRKDGEIIIKQNVPLNDTKEPSNDTQNTKVNATIENVKDKENNKNDFKNTLKTKTEIIDAEVNEKQFNVANVATTENVKDVEKNIDETKTEIIDSEVNKKQINVATNENVQDEKINNDDFENTLKTKTEIIDAEVNENQIKVSNDKTENIKITKNELKNAIDINKYVLEGLGAKDYIMPIKEMGISMCLICDWKINANAVPGHILSQHHKTMLRMQEERLLKMVKDDRDKILDSLTEFQNNDININFEANVASCKKCLKSFDLEFDAISKHIAEHVASSNKKDVKRVSLPSGSEANIKEKGNTSLYTKPVLLKKNDEALDVANTTEKDLNEMPSKAVSKTPTQSPPIISKVPMGSFFRSIIGIETNIFQDVVINEKFELNVDSFFFVSAERDFWKCLICQKVLLTDMDRNLHKIEFNHMKLLTESMVIVSLENEFIREIRPDEFHCGYCNIVTSGWDNLTVHLASSSHKESRASAEWRIREYASDIQRLGWQQRNFIEDMLSNFKKFITK